MLPVGLIGAMESEVALLLKKMQDCRTVTVGKTVFTTGSLENVSVVIARCGIGKVCAAMCAQAMIDRFAVRCLINTGVAGGIAPGLKLGDTVLSTYAVQHDFDVTAFGHVRGFLCDGGDDREPTRFAADENLRRLFAEEAAALAVPTVEGVIATGDVFVADAALKARIAAEFSAAVAEREGGAIAQTAAANRVPFLIVRAVSDLADGEAPASFDAFEKEAAARSAAVLLRVLRRL